MRESEAEYAPVVLEAARDLLAETVVRPDRLHDVQELQTALARRVVAAARQPGIPEQEIWQGLRRALEETGYEFPSTGKPSRETWTWQVARRVETIGDRLVKKGVVVRRLGSDGQAYWAMNAKLPPTQVLRAKASLDALERSFLETLANLSGHRDKAG